MSKLLIHSEIPAPKNENEDEEIKVQGVAQPDEDDSTPKLRSTEKYSGGAGNSDQVDLNQIKIQEIDSDGKGK